MQNKITIIVPMYNVENYVIKCLSSLVKQSFKDFRILAINDGSTDHTSEYAQEFAKMDNRISIIDKKNGGYGSVLEMAINSITSEYFLICDPDDWLHPKCLETLYNAAFKNDVDIVVGDRYDVYTDNEEPTVRKVRSDKIKEILPHKVYSSPSKIQLFSFFEVSPHAKLYKSSLLKNIKFPTDVSYSDFFLYMVGLANAKKAEYINVPLAYYLRDRPGNTATDIRKSIINDYVKVWKYTFNEINKVSEHDILMYRLYTQQRLILSEYKRVEKRPLFRDKYWKTIMSISRNVCENVAYKRPSFEQGFIRSVVYKLFANKYTFESVSKLYVLSK
ncbi:glycosyltransferase family 2 protein [Lactobacillus hominis]|uniref:glycosyltransferase family 2 protein n=1 Tax=Lactobacillus hominis TaxID=1203033 RepID=UPI0023EFD047|nr:glycosyltransferase family 2 protein [Lactobacillus hominis]